MPADVWMDDPTQWPPHSYPDLHHYLIKTPGVYTQEKWKIKSPQVLFELLQQISINMNLKG